MTLSISKKDLNLLVNLSDDDLVLTMRLIHKLQHKKLAEAKEYYEENTGYMTTEARELLDRKFEKAEKAAAKAAERRHQPRKPKTVEEPTELTNIVYTPFTQEFMDYLKEKWYRLHNFFHWYHDEPRATQYEYNEIVKEFFNKAPKETFIPGYKDERITIMYGKDLKPFVRRNGKPVPKSWLRIRPMV